MFLALIIIILKNKYQEEYQQSIQNYDLMNNIIDGMTTDKNIGTYSMGFDSTFVCGVINLIQRVANIFYFGDDLDGYNLEAIIGRDDYRPSYYLEVDLELIGIDFLLWGIRILCVFVAKNISLFICGIFDI